MKEDKFVRKSFYCREEGKNTIQRNMDFSKMERFENMHLKQRGGGLSGWRVHIYTPAKFSQTALKNQLLSCCPGVGMVDVYHWNDTLIKAYFF